MKRSDPKQTTLFDLCEPAEEMQDVVDFLVDAFAEEGIGLVEVPDVAAIHAEHAAWLGDEECQCGTCRREGGQS